MNRFLSNINKIPLTVKHLRSKFQLQELADHHSRNPTTCTAVNCTINQSINDLMDSVINTAAKCSLLVLNTSLRNEQALIREQRQSDQGALLVDW